MSVEAPGLAPPLFDYESLIKDPKMLQTMYENVMAGKDEPAPPTCDGDASLPSLKALEKRIMDMAFEPIETGYQPEKDIPGMEDVELPQYFKDIMDFPDNPLNSAPPIRYTLSTLQDTASLLAQLGLALNPPMPTFARHDFLSPVMGLSGIQNYSQQAANPEFQALCMDFQREALEWKQKDPQGYLNQEEIKAVEIPGFKWDPSTDREYFKAQYGLDLTIYKTDFKNTNQEETWPQRKEMVSAFGMPDVPPAEWSAPPPIPDIQLRPPRLPQEVDPLVINVEWEK